MNKILVGVCLILLIVCGVEGYSIKTLNDKLTQKEVELTNSKTSTEICKQSNEVKTAVTTVNENTCQSQIDNLRKSEETYKKANSDLMKLYEESKKKTKTLTVIKPIAEPNTPTIEEEDYEKDKNVSEYLDAVVPRDVERMSRARSHSTN